MLCFLRRYSSSSSAVIQKQQITTGGRSGGSEVVKKSKTGTVKGPSYLTVFPTLPSEDVDRISKTLSLNIVGDKISWCLISRNDKKDLEKDGKGEGQVSNGVKLKVEDLQQIVYPYKPRMHFLSLLKEIEGVVKEIPETELCILEEYPATTPTPYMFNFQMQMAQVKAMILASLSCRKPNPPMAISIKTVNVAKIFNTYVGSERVSGQPIVENMMFNQSNPLLDVDYSVLQMYPTLLSAEKEALSHTVLLNLAYWRITKQISIAGQEKS